MSRESARRRQSTQTEKPASWIGIRHIQYMMLFAVMMTAYAIRAILSVAIYAMTNESSPDSSIPTYPEWESHKNVMLSSFFWGYICFQVVAGQLAKKYGPKYFVVCAKFIGSLFCALIPFFGAHFGWEGVIACRIITGMTQGFLFPCFHHLISAWAPLRDRAKIGSLVYAAGPLGNMVAFPVAGWISASSIGWPCVFYLFGGLGVFLSILWFFLVCDSPAKHKSISMVERKYIESGIEGDEDKEKVPTPWKSIFTSLPFWAILITHCGQNFGFWTLLTEIPSYMNKVLDFEIAKNSTLSALPYLVNWLLSLVMSPIADYLIVNYMSVGTSRKIFNSIGLFIPALALFCLSFVGKSQALIAVILLVIAVGFNSAVYSGYNVNHIDLSPVHAGTLMGLTNSISNLFSLVSPLAVDLMKYITGYEESDRKLWTVVFCVAATVYTTAGIFYACCGSGKVQPWNGTQSSRRNSDETVKQDDYIKESVGVQLTKI